jgi:ribosome-binding factor A
MPSDFNRKDRFNRMLKEELSRLLSKEIRDPRLSHVRITDVETTGDLSHAKIYYRIEDLTNSLHDEVRKGLSRATPFLRGRLGRDLHIRFAPTLTFEPDATLEYGSHIEALLDQIQTGASDNDDDSD